MYAQVMYIHLYNLLALPASLAFFHIRIRRSCPALKSSTHCCLNGGSLRPGSPSAGSPASCRSCSKYASKSGFIIINPGPSPFFAMRSCSHFRCSSRDGSCAFPARTRAAATACHSKTLKVNPAPTYSSQLLVLFNRHEEDILLLRTPGNDPAGGTRVDRDPVHGCFGLGY